jgi:hypothetical protein
MVLVHALDIPRQGSNLTVIFPEFFFSCAATVSPSKVVPMKWPPTLVYATLLTKRSSIVGFEEVVDGELTTDGIESLEGQTLELIERRVSVLVDVPQSR